MHQSANDHNPGEYVYWTARRTLSVLAGSALAANTLKEWCEWRADAENVAAFAHLRGQCARNACCRYTINEKLK
jgi:hypothetical protein